MRVIGYILVLCCAVWLIVGCANPVTPQGGPKDVDAPKIILTNPEYLALNFNGKEITLTFDEWVVLNNPTKNFISSPLLSKEPKIKLKKRTVHVTFADTLRKNTTYNFYFGDMIADFNEGNIYKGLTFTLSTGSYLDSLAIGGKLLNAYDLKPLGGHVVMGYIESALPDSISKDSIAAKLKPDFVTATDEAGNFNLRFLPDKGLRLVALKDINGNYLYNPELNEEIAFWKEIVRPINDKDTVVSNDTTHRVVKLLNFKPVDSVNRVAKVEEGSPMRLDFFMKYPTANLKYRFIKAKQSADSIEYISRLNKTGDSLSLWFRKYNDSLTLEFSDNGKIIDTVKAVVSSFEKIAKAKRNAYKPTMQLKYASNYHYFKPLELEFSTPVSRINTDSIKLIFNKDTIVPHFVIDSLNPLRVMIDRKLMPGTKYQLIVPDSAFVDIYGHYFPKSNFNIGVRSKESYGNFELTVDNLTNEVVVVQLLNEKDAVVRETVIEGKGMKIKFDLLNRGEYKVKAFVDINKNGLWDTGSYYKQRYPEPVLFFEKKISIRESWDIEEKWTIEL